MGNAGRAHRFSRAMANMVWMALAGRNPWRRPICISSWRIFDCDAWNSLMAMPDRIASIAAKKLDKGVAPKRGVVPLA